MIGSKMHLLTLTYEEAYILEEYLRSNELNHLERITAGASFSASPHGISILFGSEEAYKNVFSLVERAFWEKEDELENEE